MRGLSHEAAVLEDNHVSGDFMRDPGLLRTKSDTRTTLRYENGKAILDLRGGTSEDQDSKELRGEEDEEKCVDEESDEEEEVDSSEEVEGADSDSSSEEGVHETEDGCGLGSDLDSEEADENLDEEELPQKSPISDASRKEAALELPYTFTGWFN